jgi:predicted transcriptional regulator
MSNNYEEIVSAAMTLPPATKTMLAEHLPASLDAPARKEPERVDASGATITLTLDSELERRLLQEASRHGLSPEQYAVQALEEYILRTARERREKAIALVQSWIDEGDEEEQKETWEYLVRVLDEDRTSVRKLFPEELKGVSW